MYYSHLKSLKKRQNFLHFKPAQIVYHANMPLRRLQVCPQFTPVDLATQVETLVRFEQHICAHPQKREIVIV